MSIIFGGELYFISLNGLLPSSHCWSLSASDCRPGSNSVGASASCDWSTHLRSLFIRWPFKSDEAAAFAFHIQFMRLSIDVILSVITNQINCRSHPDLCVLCVLRKGEINDWQRKIVICIQFHPSRPMSSAARVERWAGKCRQLMQVQNKNIPFSMALKRAVIMRAAKRHEVEGPSTRRLQPFPSIRNRTPNALNRALRQPRNWQARTRCRRWEQSAIKNRISQSRIHLRTNDRNWKTER